MKMFEKMKIGTRVRHVTGSELADAKKVYGICKILLAFHQGDARHVATEDGFDLFRSGFCASYGWNRVMVDAFFEMSWALEKGSYPEIDRDGGHDIYEVELDDDDVEVWENHCPPYHRR